MKMLINLIFLLVFLLGSFLVYNSLKPYSSTNTSTNIKKTNELESKSDQLKKILLENKKPLRVEIVSLTNRYQEDIAEIKHIKIPLNPESDYYLHIRFFTHENIETAPLIAQIRFFDVKTNNLLKEQSIDLK